MDSVIRVLHVDDDQSLAELVATFLERERPDLSVTSVASGQAALDALDSGERFDCVVTDYDMPGMDGVEVIQEIRERNTDLPVILFTGKGSEEVASDAVSAGVTEYMQKETGTDQYLVLANRIYNVATAYRTTRRFKDTRERYQRLVEDAPNAILVVEAGPDSATIAFANRTASRWYTAADSPERSIDGLELDEFVHPDSLGDFRDAFRTTLDADPCGWRRGRLHADFGGRHVEYTAAQVNHRGRDAAQFVFQDVTDRVERSRALESLLGATHDLIETETDQAVFELVAETAAEVLDLPRVGVWRYDPDAEALVSVVYPAADEAPELPDDPPTFRAGDSLSWDAFEAGETRVYDDLRDLPTHNESTRIRCEVIVPIGRFGVLNAGSATPASIPDQSVSLAEVLAASAAAVLASRRNHR